MATLKPINSKTLTREAAYYQLCRLMARNVRIGHFYGRELYEAMQRPSVKLFAELAMKKYFNQGEDTAKVKRDMQLMYQALLVMVPILQRIPRSMHLDQHRGHVLTWLRIYVGGNARRRYLSVKEVEREHNPVMLTKRLKQLGIHDRTFTKVLVALFRAYYWRDTVAGSLARILFDPIMLDVPRDRHTLRVGNRIYILHKEARTKSCNLNKSPFVIFEYAVRYDTSALQNKLTITLSLAAVAAFKQKIRGVMKRKADAKYKAAEIEKAINRFTEKAKWAKDDQLNIIKLRNWLWQTMQPLLIPKSGTARPAEGNKKLPEAQLIENKAKKEEAAALKDEFGHIPNVLLNKWLQKRTMTTGLIRAKSNVLYELVSVDIDVFLNFLSPYREV